VQIFNTIDDQCVGTRTTYSCAHGYQKICQVYDFGFLGCIFYHACAFGQNRRHHDIFRAGHGDRIKYDIGTFQALCGGLDIAIDY